MSDPLAKLEQVLALLNDSLSKADFVKAFEGVVEFVQRIQATNDKEFTTLKANLTALAKQVKEDASSDVSELRQQVELVVGSQLDTIRERLAQVRDGKTPTADELRALIRPLIPVVENGKPGKDGSPDTGDEIITKINKAEELIDSKAIEGLEQLKKDVQEKTGNTVRLGWGAKGIGLYVGNSKKLLTAQTINFVAGTGMTITYAHSNGRNDLTFSSSGGGGGSLSVLAATGTVDDSNTTFTFASEPTLVVVNGASYRDGHGCTIVTTTVTLDNPVGSGGDIYGLGA